MRKGRADGCHKRRVMEERWTESTQTGDVGGNNVGVGCYLYLQERRWARGKGSTVCLNIVYYFMTKRKTDCVKNWKPSLMVCKMLNPPIWKLCRGIAEKLGNVLVLNNLNSFRMERRNVYHAIAASVKLRRANASYYCLMLDFQPQVQVCFASHIKFWSTQPV